MKLWVDDLRDPAAFGRPGWHWVKSNTEAIRVLDTRNDIEEISLDWDICHTLGVEGLVGAFACTETFEGVTRFIGIWARMQELADFPITIHTSSVVGAKTAEDILTMNGDDDSGTFIITHKYGAKL